MNRKLLIAICLLAAILAGPGAFAQEEEVKLLVNELKVFPVVKLSRVAVGNPEVADVTVLNEREVMLVAQEDGVTTLIIWDEQGKREYNIIVKKKDIEDDVQRIKNLFTASNIEDLGLTVEKGNIYIMGEVANQVQLEKVKNILGSFDNTVNLTRVRDRQPLIEIDVNVLEVAFDDLKRLGVNWNELQPITYSEPSGHDIDGKTPKLWRIFRWDRTTIDARLNLLIQEDRARTLANPKLTTLSGKEASFLVGGEVPYVTVETEGRTKVEWKDYGVNLTINPEATSANEIRTQLLAEVTGLDWGNAVTQDGYNIPALRKREVQTELFLSQGDTIFLAGLIKNDDSRNVDRLPWLGKVPILGELFKSTQFRDERTELVISISPRIVAEPVMASAVPLAPVTQAALKEQDRKMEASLVTPYAEKIGELISANVVYPEQAQQANQEGVVKVDMHLLSSGNLKDAKIKESSGYDLLDNSALLAVLGQAPYPPFPSNITQKELRLTIPVVFKSYVKNE
ncbi:MAG: TonB family protein [Candidatus Omnitrophica bacterium]|nr:TonB family protein [Candidatus Omnitrophota bacterium]